MATLMGAYPLFRSVIPGPGPFNTAEPISREEVIPGKLAVAVYLHGIKLRDGMLSCWSYVSEGMERYGQREIVFTLRLPPYARDWDCPEEPYGLFRTIFDYAEKGNLVPAGGLSVLRPGSKVLGCEGQWGFMYLPAEMLEGVEMRSNALAAVLIKDDETDLIQEGLFYRIATCLGKAYRYYPFPPWSDPERGVAVTNGHFQKSILSKLRLLRMAGITLRAPCEIRGRAKGPWAARGDRRTVFRPEIVMRISREALPVIQSCLPAISDGPPVALLTDPDPLSFSRLCWLADPDLTGSIAIGQSLGEWVTGGFISLGHGEGVADRGFVVEDGFGVALGTKSWKKLEEAIAQGFPVKISLGTDGSSLEVEIPPAPSPDRAFRIANIGSYGQADQLRERVVDLHRLSDYSDRLEEAASSVLSGYPRSDAPGLLLVVGLKPGGEVRVWCDPAEGELPDLVLTKLKAEIEKVPPPAVRLGPVALFVAGNLWGKKVTRFPPFPGEWMKAAAEAGKGLGIPDELFGIIWPD